MKQFLTAILFAAFVPFGAASAFQVIAPEQMQDSGLGLAEGRYFTPEQNEQNARMSVTGSGQMQFFGRQRDAGSLNFYGQLDGGGRYFGDTRRSSFQGCDYAQSNAARMDVMGGRGYSYPCQRFR